MGYRAQTWRNTFIIESDRDDPADDDFINAAISCLNNKVRKDVQDRYLSLMGGKKVTIRFVGDISNPEWAEGKFISGERLCKIVRQRKDGKPKSWWLDYVLLHEIAHGVDAYSGGESGERDNTMPLMNPAPNSWSDTKGGDPYWHDPSENFAHEFTYAQLVDIGSVSDSQNDDYTRKIANDELPELRSFWISDEAPQGGEPPDTEEPPDPCSSTMVYSDGDHHGEGYYATKLNARIDEALAKLEQRVATGKATAQTLAAMRAVLRPVAIDEDE